MATTPVIVGVDVGGTNTDAVVISRVDDTPTVISAFKEPTSHDVTTGIERAIYSALKQTHDSGYKVGVTQVNIGTTHLVNAVVQGKNLSKVAVIRLCGSASQSLPPFSDFPEFLKNIIFGSVYLVKGGYRYDGQLIDEIDEAEIISVIQDIKKTDVQCIVVSGIFSPIRNDQEIVVRELIERVYHEASVTLSNDIGHLGLLERENAAILNESLKPLCKRTIEGFKTALQHIGLECPLFLTQNNGTIIEAEKALPIFTFDSGPTSSMIGASYLSQVKNAIVVDIGGTTTDVGILQNGFPREASTQVKIGGIKTNFKMPDVLSIGLGGGSYVVPHYTGSSLSSVSVGPRSAGCNLENEALIFSNKDDASIRYITASDIAVAGGLSDIGNRSEVKQLETNVVNMAINKIHSMIEEAIDKMIFNKDNLPVILVGGGSILIDIKRNLKGVDTIILPKHFGVANACGAALCQVSGKVDSVCKLMDRIDVNTLNKIIREATNAVKDNKLDTKEVELVQEEAKRSFFVDAKFKALEQACEEAKDIAVKSGASRSSVKITEKCYSDLAYIPGNAIRIQVTSVGELTEWHNSNSRAWDPINIDYAQPGSKFNEHVVKQTETAMDATLDPNVLEASYLVPTDPEIDPHTGEWNLSKWDIECIVIGPGIMGCGGGGSPHIGRLKCLNALKKGKKMRIISPERLLQNAHLENDRTVTIAFMGAPLVQIEQLMSFETKTALQSLKDLYGISGYRDSTIHNYEAVEISNKDGVTYIDNYNPQSRKVTDNSYDEVNIIALMSAEIGGANAVEPLLVSADLDIPVVDADGMGRAFPELQMFCPFIYDSPAFPAVLASDVGRNAVVVNSSEAKAVENYFRDTVVAMGCIAGLAMAPLKKEDVLNKTVHRSFSRVWRIGNAVLTARIHKTCPIDAILGQENSKLLISGKIQNVQLETSAGFNKGLVIIEGLDTFSGQYLKVEFQNENLVVFPIADDCKSVTGDALACVPDLIVVVDADTGEPITTEEVKYGLRVALLVLASNPLLRTEKALKVVGPQAFRYPKSQVNFKPFADAKLITPIPPV